MGTERHGNMNHRTQLKIVAPAALGSFAEWGGGLQAADLKIGVALARH